MIELQMLDDQLRHFLDNFTLFTDEEGRHNPVWSIFDTFTRRTSEQNQVEYEYIEEFVSLLWRFYPNQQRRLQAFYDYRRDYTFTYSRIVDTTFAIHAECFPHTCTYRAAVEQLILLCLTD